MQRTKANEKLIINYIDIDDELVLKLKEERCKIVYDITLRYIQTITEDEARAGAKEARASAPARA